MKPVNKNDHLGYLEENKLTFHKELSAVILAGGMGSRLNPELKRISLENYPKMSAQFDGEVGPKGMTKMSCDLSGESISKPLNDWHLDIHCQSEEIQKFYLSLGCRADILSDYYQQQYQQNYKGREIEFLFESKPAGTAAPLVKLLLEGRLDDTPLIYANGDNLIDLDLYEVYLSGLVKAHKAGLNLDALVIDVLALVPWEDSHNYGTVDLNQDTGQVLSFKEKAPIEENSYVELKDQKYSFINSGFSIINNPAYFMQHYVSDELIETSTKLEAGELAYSDYEKVVKYETIYSLVAQERNMIGVFAESYWTDLGTEEKIALAEKHFPNSKLFKD